MNPSELPPADARHIVRRYVHDLNNIANCLHLELSLLTEEAAHPALAQSFDKVRRQVTQLEAVIRSLAVRFAPPSACVVSAHDVYQSWRDKVDQGGHGPALQWEEPASNPLINIDFNAVLTVLREICLVGGVGDQQQTRAARLIETDDRATFEIRDSADAGSGVSVTDALAIDEWKRIVAASGGEFLCSCDAAGSPCVTRLSFPKAAPPPALFRDS